MHAATDRLEFAPPHEPAAVRAFTLAILAHLLLMAALTWGINWQKETEDVTAEAELWAAIPSEPAPVPPPAPVITAPPVPTPRVETPPPPPVVAEPDINLERDKRRQELERQRAEELELQKKLEAKRKRDELEREKQAEAKRRQDELKKQELAEQKAAEDKRRKDEQARAAKEKLDTARLEKIRKENIARMMKGAESATGGAPTVGLSNAAAGKSTSAGYGARVQARVRPYIVYPDDQAGNPEAVVEVKCSPDGTIVSSRVVKPSSSRMWDDAVIAALTKAQTLPRDIDGKVPTPLEITFKRHP